MYNTTMPVQASLMKLIVCGRVTCLKNCHVSAYIAPVLHNIMLCLNSDPEESTADNVYKIRFAG